MLNTVLKFKDKYKNTDERSKKMYKNTIAMIGIRGFSIIITLISAPIMLHHVDRADYGVLLTLTSIVGWVGMMDIGLGNGLRNKLPEFLKNKDFIYAKKIVSSCYATLAIYVAVIITIFLALSPFINWLSVLNSPTSDAEEIRKLADVVFITFCIQFLLGLFNSFCIPNTCFSIIFYFYRTISSFNSINNPSLYF